MGHLAEQQYEITNNADMATQAIDAYKKALDLEPNSPIIMERLAEIYAKSQRIRDAVSEAQQVLKVDPNNVAARRLLARIYVRTLGDMNAGAVQQENLAKADRAVPGHSEDSAGRHFLRRCGSRGFIGLKIATTKQKRCFAGFCSTMPITARRSNSSASSWWMKADRRKRSICSKRPRMIPSSPDIYDLLGDAYSQQKDYAKAEEAYQKAVDEDPDDPGIATAWPGVALAGQVCRSARTVHEAFRARAGNRGKLSAHGAARPPPGQVRQAEASLLKAKELSPGSLEVLYNEALLYEDQGRYDDAVKVLTDAIAGIKSQATSDDNANALSILYEQLGHAYREQQKYPEAIQTFRRWGNSARTRKSAPRCC